MGGGFGTVSCLIPSFHPHKPPPIAGALGLFIKKDSERIYGF